MKLVGGLCLLAVFGALLVGCGDGPDVPPTEEPTNPPLIGVPVLGPASQEITFQGPVEGEMTDADASCAWAHGSTPEKGRYNLLLQGFFAGARHTLRVTVNGYTGPGDYSWDGVDGSGAEVTLEVDGKQKGHGTVFVEDPGDTGELDMIITTPDQGRVHGFFQCPGIPK